MKTTPKKRGRPKKIDQKLNSELLDLEDSLLDEEPIPESKPFPIKSANYEPKIISEDSDTDDEDKSLIEPELRRYEEQIHQIYQVLDSVNPLAIQDIEERLKSVKLKADLLVKLPTLLKSLEDLRERNKLKSEQIRGARDVSPLEDGTLDD